MLLVLTHLSSCRVSWSGPGNNPFYGVLGSLITEGFRSLVTLSGTIVIIA